MKKVILRYPQDKSFNQRKLKITATETGLSLHKYIDQDLIQFRNKEYYLILRSENNCLSFLDESQQLETITDNKQIKLILVLPPPTIELTLPNQTPMKTTLNLKQTVAENINELFEKINLEPNGFSLMTRNDDFLNNDFTFFFQPLNNEIFDDNYSTSSNEIFGSDNSHNYPTIVSTSLPLLFQGWSGEKLTLIRRVSPIDLLIASEKRKEREKQIEKMKETLNNSQNEKPETIQTNLTNIPLQLSEKSKSAINIEVENDTDFSLLKPNQSNGSNNISSSNELNENDQNGQLSLELNGQQHQNQSEIVIDHPNKSVTFNTANSDKKEDENNPAIDAITEISKHHSDLNRYQKSNYEKSKYFDFTIQDFFFNCQLAILNKLCVFDDESWAALACLQCVASHGNLSITQIQTLLPFIPDSVRNQQSSDVRLTDMLSKMKRRLYEFDQTQAMEAYIDTCINDGLSFCYIERIKFWVITQKWPMSSKRYLLLSPNMISISKDLGVNEFISQYELSDVVDVTFDGDYIIIAFDNKQNEKWRIKSNEPQILLSMIDELRTKYFHSLNTLASMLSSSKSLGNRTINFKKLLAKESRAKSQGIMPKLMNKNLPRKVKIHDEDNLVYFSDHLLPHFTPNETEFEPGISKLICCKDEEVNESCIEKLRNETYRNLKMISKLEIPRYCSNRQENSYVYNLPKSPDYEYVSKLDAQLSFYQKNQKLIDFIVLIVGLLFSYFFMQ